MALLSPGCGSDKACRTTLSDRDVNQGATGPSSGRTLRGSGEPWRIRGEGEGVVVAQLAKMIEKIVK